MRLVAIEYAQHEGTASQWQLKDLQLGDINLIVGKNASGKTWTLNIIKGLASLLAAEVKLSFKSGHYRATFRDGQDAILYELNIKDKVVIHESLTLNSAQLLDRGPGGTGAIMATELGQHMKFQTPEDELAAVARRDSIQHPFLEALHRWGKTLYYYPFGTSLGKHTVAVLLRDAPPANTKNAMQVIGIFQKAEAEFGETFKNAVMEDMARLGYPIEVISLAESSLQTAPEIELPGPLLAIRVKERDLSTYTEQHTMSQGMFRALSLIIQLNYGAMADSSATIIIDDIGEGLDFDRSCALINLVIEKAEKSRVQLIMATNDRFVMNRVPIEAWTVLKRIDGGSQVYNYSNSREVFDNFKYTGLNNFDFLAADFIDNQEPPNA